MALTIAATAAAQPAAGPASAAPAESAAADAGDIVVTAQRRSERLTSVPISVTALSATRLDTAGIVTTSQLGQITPGLLVTQTGVYVQPSIRGISNSLTAPGADNSVAIYIDGVYQPAQAALAFELNNVRQVEVLKGPQGTLFGRNAAGGAILVSTLDPSFRPEARLGASYGRFDDVKLNAYLDAPLVADTLAANATLLYRHQDSYSTNVFTHRSIRGLEEVAARGKLRLDPGGDLSFVLAGGYSRTINDRFQATQGFNGTITQNVINPALVATNEPFHFAHNEQPRLSIRTEDVSLHGSWKLGFGTLATISSYGDALTQPSGDYDYSQLAVNYGRLRDRQRTHAEEATFTSDRFGPLSVIAGLFYYDDRARRFQRLYTSSALQPYRVVRARLDTTAYAAFGEVNLDLTRRLHAIAGVRYSDEKKDASAVQTGIVAAALAPVHKSFHAVTPRASLRYDVTSASSAYMTFSKGFKSGTFNYTALSGIPVNPEHVTAYEAGYKYARGPLRFSAAAYYNDYTGLQVQSLLAYPVFTLQNAASARIYGGEAEAEWRLSETWQVQAGAAYTHARYRRFSNALVTAPNAAGVITSFVADASGNSLIRSPAFTANLTPTYQHRLAAGTLSASVTGSYTSHFYWAPDNRIRQPGYAKLNALVSFTTADERWRFSLWGRNLTNKHNLVTQVSSGVGDIGIFDEPALYGVSVGVTL